MGRDLILVNHRARARVNNASQQRHGGEDVDGHPRLRARPLRDLASHRMAAVQAHAPRFGNPAIGDSNPLRASRVRRTAGARRRSGRVLALPIAVAIAGMIGFCAQAVEAEAAADGSEARPGDLGLNVFGLSFHTDRSAGYNEINPGLGLRYVFWRPQPRWELFGDTSIYYDSDRNWAKYVALGTYYRFAGPWKAGAAIAYGQSRSYNQGRPFFAPVPGLAFEYRGVTLNAVLLPSEESDSKISGGALFLTIPLGHRN